MAKASEEEKADHLKQKISRVLNDALTSSVTHSRRLKDLFAIRSSSSSLHQFSSAFCAALTPLFQFQRRTAAAERAIRFVAAFATARNASADASDSDAFLEDFLRFLVVGTAAACKSTRLCSCQIISEIIIRLPDDAEVENQLWDEVIDCLKIRLEDKIPMIRTFAVRALSRFANDSDNSDILELFLRALSLEQSAEVRKAIVLSLPPSNMTSSAVIDSTMDVSEQVRKAAYYVLANKFPLQSLSIKFRTVILQRGLTDRSVAVANQCLKLLTDEWLVKCCSGDPIGLLKFLDVETYESVGESVMSALLKSGLIKLQDGQSIQDFIVASGDGSQGERGSSNCKFHLMEPEVAIYWRTVCKHLQTEAQAKGSDAASAVGTEAAVYAAEATDSNDLLERVLPATVSDYIHLVKVHLNAGPNFRFASRQLLLLGAMLDFSDSMNRKVASGFVQELLRRPLEHDLDDYGNIVIIGDGINIGGDRDWANAVVAVAKKVHAAAGEFEEIFLGVVGDLIQPCRDRTADVMQWMHSLAVTGLLLENAKSYHCLQGKLIEPVEILQSLLLPGAKHIHSDVQRIAVRCLGIFGLLESKLSEELVKQIRLSFSQGMSPVSLVAAKALFDLGLWHGLQELDRAIGKDLPLRAGDERKGFIAVDWSSSDADLDIGILDLLYAGFDRKVCEKPVFTDENELVQDVIGEGFAKFLLLSGNYSSIPASLHPLILSKLINLYFSNETDDLQRMKQCLSVFFEHYPSLSADHKKFTSEAFIPVMHSMWPGINGNVGGSNYVVSIIRKRASQASRFMLQMMQVPLYEKEPEDKTTSAKDMPETLGPTVQSSLESGEEGLAIRIATEVASFPLKKTAAEKQYVLVLCKILVLLNFRISEPEAIKLTRKLLSHVAESISGEKEMVKELKRMAERLKAMDTQPDLELSKDEANLIFGRLGLAFNFDADDQKEMPKTPLRSARPMRRRVKTEDTSSDEEHSPTSLPAIASTIGRSQRASKTAALNKITASRCTTSPNNEEEEDGSSEVTSEDDSDDESDQYSQ